MFLAGNASTLNPSQASGENVNVAVVSVNLQLCSILARLPRFIHPLPPRAFYAKEQTATR